MRYALLPLIATVLWASSPFSFREVSSTSLEASENGRPVFVYNYGMLRKPGDPGGKGRSSYIHPLYAPDGTVVSDDFPKDHWHHRGVFWTWPVVKTGGETYDLWAVSGIWQRFERWTARETSAKSARLGVENGWYTPERKVLKETIEILIHPAEGEHQRMDFVLRFKALDRPVEIMGRPKAGYGGFGIRLAPREHTTIQTDAGEEAGDTDLMPHPWAEMEGDFEGRRAGVRIEIDSSNAGFPNGWCLRQYGFLGVDFPGVQLFQIKRGETLTLRYRLRVFSRPD